MVIDCPECSGLGCERCEKKGRTEYKECPQKMLDRQTKEVVKHSEWMDRGFLPSIGGTLDQSASLMEQCQFYHEEKNRVEAERYKK